MKLFTNPFSNPTQESQTVFTKQSLTLWRSITGQLCFSFASKFCFPQLWVWKLSRCQQGRGVITRAWHVNFTMDSSVKRQSNNVSVLECGGGSGSCSLILGSIFFGKIKLKRECVSNVAGLQTLGSFETLKERSPLSKARVNLLVLCFFFVVEGRRHPGGVPQEK